MTRKPLAPTWRTLGRWGDGEWTVSLPGHKPGEACNGCLAERYTATARMRKDRPALLAVTMTDRGTGATFGWTAHGDRVTMRLASDATAAGREQLWKDGRDIIGLARRQSGGPARGTGVQVDELVLKAVELRTEGGWPTEGDLADGVGRDVRTVQRIASSIPGPGTPYEKVLALAAMRLRP